MKKKRTKSYSYGVHPAAQREIDCIPIRSWSDEVKACIRASLVGVTNPPRGIPVPNLPGFYRIGVGERYTAFYTVLPAPRHIELLGVLELAGDEDFTFH